MILFISLAYWNINIVTKIKAAITNIFEVTSAIVEVDVKKAISLARKATEGIIDKIRGIWKLKKLFTAKATK